MYICYSDKSSSNSSVDCTRSTAVPNSSSVSVREERPNVIISQSVSTHTRAVDSDAGNNNNNAYTFTTHNDVVDEYDDDLDAAMMDVDLGMFDDDLVDENQAGHRRVTDDSSASGVSSMPMEISNRTTSLKTVSEVLTIVKDKCFHGTVRIKVNT